VAILELLIRIGGVDILKSREKMIKIFIILFIVILLLFLILFIFLKIYSRWTEDKIVNKQEEIIKEQEKFQEEIIENFKDNKDLFDKLVNNLYSREEEIKINFSNDMIKYIVNGKEEELDSEEYIFYEQLYSLMKCNRLKLYKDSDGNKIIEIYLYSVDGHDDFIIYNKDNEENLIYEFAPGWYYETFWYT